MTTSRAPAPIETLRGLLVGTGIGNNGWPAIVWCLELVVLGRFWSTSKFYRGPRHPAGGSGALGRLRRRGV